MPAIYSQETIRNRFNVTRAQAVDELTKEKCDEALSDLSATMTALAEAGIDASLELFPLTSGMVFRFEDDYGSPQVFGILYIAHERRAVGLFKNYGEDDPYWRVADDDFRYGKRRTEKGGGMVFTGKKFPAEGNGIFELQETIIDIAARQAAIKSFDSGNVFAAAAGTLDKPLPRPRGLKG